MDGMELAALILTSGVVGGVSVEFVRAIFNRRSNQADVRLKRATATGEIADAAQTMVGISVDRAERLEDDNLKLRDKVDRLVERVKDAEAFKVVLETQMLESNKMRVVLEEAAAKQAYEINRLKERVASSF